MWTLQLSFLSVSHNHHHWSTHARATWQHGWSCKLYKILLNVHKQPAAVTLNYYIRASQTDYIKNWQFNSLVCSLTLPPTPTTLLLSYGMYIPQPNSNLIMDHLFLEAGGIFTPLSVCSQATCRKQQTIPSTGILHFFCLCWLHLKKWLKLCSYVLYNLFLAVIVRFL